jgi:uncharacterized protein (TIGR00730 family)
VAGSNRTSDLIADIREAADKFERDGSTRGDLKLVSRSLRELRYALKVFAPYRRTLKVSVFGSARTKPEAPAYQQAEEFGSQIATHGWMVITGAASGIMEAGHAGAGRENSMGLNILLPFEQDANPVIEGDPKLVHMKYFFTRKLMFVKECQAVVCLPGGFGTLDEALEVLTLLQTGKRELIPLLLLDEPGGSYWTNFQRFIDDTLLAGHMISPQDLELYRITDSVDEAVHELVTFYQNFHSLRYVRQQLVFRLHAAPTAASMQTINQEFRDILVGGDYQLSEALPEEKDDPGLNCLPRLTFQFDRRNHGRLRNLVDFLNRCPTESDGKV